MAITTDTGAKKIENSENWRNIFGIHNDSVDAYDALAEQKDEEIGIVVKGNKTAHTGGAAAGQYIILRNSTITGCDDGLYKAAQAIPYDTAIDSTYLTPVSGGGLNALNASMKYQLLWNGTDPQDSTPIQIPSIQDFSEIVLLFKANGAAGIALFPVNIIVNQYNYDNNNGNNNRVFAGSYVAAANGRIYVNAPEVKVLSDTSIAITTRFADGWNAPTLQTIWGRK